MTLDRHRPAPGPLGGGGRTPKSPPHPKFPAPAAWGGPGQLCTKTLGLRRRAAPRVPSLLPAPRGPARSARGAAHELPPRTKGRPTAPRVARGRRGAWPGPLPESPPRGALARPERRRRRRALRPQCRPPRPVGSVRPATPAAAASSSCGGRHVPPPARAPATPTPGHAHGPPHAPPGAAVDPSAARAASFRLASFPPALLREVAAASRRSLERTNGIVHRSVIKWRGEPARTIFPRGGARGLGRTASMTQAGKDREMER